MCAHTLQIKIVERTSKEKNSFNPLNLYSSSFQIDMPKCINKNAGGENQIRQVGAQSERGSLGLQEGSLRADPELREQLPTR